MNSATVILWVIALILLGSAWLQGREIALKGFQAAWGITRQNGLLIVLAFVLVGYVNVLNPENLVTAWIGPDSGWQGIFSAEFLGMLLPGGPYVVFPLIAILSEAGAGLAPLITLITSWATQSLLTVSFELPFMGWRFTAIRWGTSLIIPLMAGIIALLIWG